MLCLSKLILAASFLIVDLKGFSPSIYTDKAGHPTIGYGYNLSVYSYEGKRITKVQAYGFLTDILKENHKALLSYGWYKNLDAMRRMVILDLSYNLGLKYTIEKVIKEVGLELKSKSVMPYFFNEYDLTKNANREEPERLRRQVISILMRTPKGREILKEYLNEGCILLGERIRKSAMLKSFKKAFLGLYVWVCWVYWGIRQEPNPKELVLLGIKSYKEQDFSQAKEF
nr:lysozyme [Helicobacter pylori]